MCYVGTTLRVFFADQEEIVNKSLNCIRCTVNPLLTPLPFSLFISNTFHGGGGNRTMKCYICD